MTEHRDANDGWVGRWAQKRRAKAQQRLERRYFEQEHLRDETLDAVNAGNSAARASAYGSEAGWVSGLGE